MKKLLLYSLILFMVGACKKEESKIEQLPQYAVSFYVYSDQYPFAIAFNQASGNTRAEIINQPGLKYYYGAVDRTKDLFVVLAKGAKVKATYNIIWNIDNVPFHADSITLVADSMYHTFRWKIPEN